MVKWVTLEALYQIQIEETIFLIIPFRFQVDTFSYFLVAL